MKKATIIFTTAFIILFAILQIANAESQLEKWEKIVKPGSPTEQVLTTLKAIDDSKNLLKLLKKRDKQLQKLRQTNIENKRVKGKYAQFRNDILEAIDD